MPSNHFGPRLSTTSDLNRHRDDKGVPMKSKVDEGSPCDCGGQFVFMPDGECTCHLGRSPCGACEGTKLICNICDEGVPDDEG